MKRITSRHHPLVTLCRTLARGGREAQGLILLDGPHLVQEACAAGIEIETAAATDGFLQRPDAPALGAALARAGAEMIAVSDQVLEAMSPVSAPAGIVAVARRPATPLAAVLSRPPQLVLLGVDIQDPGNVGAMARAGEAAGATGLALCGASADPLGWKALRGSMGSLFRLPTAAGLAWPEAVAAAKAAGIRVLAAAPRGAATVYELDLRVPVAFLLGAEGPGLPPVALAEADETVSIPMRHPVESLNVSVAAALLVYEAARQRAVRFHRGGTEAAETSAGPSER